MNREQRWKMHGWVAMVRLRCNDDSVVVLGHSSLDAALTHLRLRERSPHFRSDLVAEGGHVVDATGKVLAEWGNPPAREEN